MDGHMDQQPPGPVTGTDPTLGSGRQPGKLIATVAVDLLRPALRWCASHVDRDDRRHDERRTARFWGDAE
jgi:hypothetical protein